MHALYHGCRQRYELGQPDSCSDDTSDYLRINGTANSSGVSRTVPLVTGINQVTIAVSPDNYLYRNYILTIYRLP